MQEVVIEGQDKVFKDVIEPLESVSVNMIPTGKQDIRDFGPPEQVNIISELALSFLNDNIEHVLDLTFLAGC